jgi:hypothetical protein
VLTGGVIAAYVLQQNQAAPITPGDGALVGLLAGFVGAIVQVIVSIPISLMIGPMERAMVQRVLEMAGNMPPEMREMFERFGSEGPRAGFFIITRIVGLIFWMCVGAVFSTLGGLIGAAIFKKHTPPGTIDVTPTTPTTPLG